MSWSWKNRRSLSPHFKARFRAVPKKCRELEKSLGTSTRELEALRETAGKVTKLEQDAQDANEMMKAMEKVKKALSEREKRVTELESEVTRLKKEIQNSQRFVKAVSQENDTLRDSLSVWEQEASKIRQHVHQLSQDADSHNQNGEESKSSKSQDVDKVCWVLFTFQAFS